MIKEQRPIIVLSLQQTRKRKKEENQMTKREIWKSFFMSPNTWRGFQNICVILFGGISWIYGTKALKEISLHFYEYITKYHFHDDGALLSIVQHIDISAYNCIYYPLLIGTVFIILFDCFVIEKNNRLTNTLRYLVSFNSIIGILGFFGGLLPNFIINGEKDIFSVVWVWLIVILVSYLFLGMIRRILEVQQSSFRGRKDIILQQQVNISSDEKE